MMRKKRTATNVISEEECNLISFRAKNEKKKRENDHKNEMKEKEVWDLVDQRIERLKEENKLFNKLKREEIERRRRESQEQVKSIENVVIPSESSLKYDNSSEYTAHALNIEED